MPPPTLPHPTRRTPRILLELDVTHGLAEAPPTSPVEAARRRQTPVVRHVVDGLRRGARDDRVAGLVVHVGSRQPDLALAGEVREAVRRFGHAGKRTVCWSETYGEMGPGNVGYHLATGCDEVWLQPSGDLGLTGVVAEAVFVRGLLDKLDVVPELSQRHEFKTAADTLMREQMSDAHRTMSTRLVESLTQVIVADVAAARHLTPDDVEAAMARSPLTAHEAKDHGLIDRIGYRDEVYDHLRGRLGDIRPQYVERYRKHSLRRREPTKLVRRRRAEVAVVQASGPIHLGRSGTSPFASASVGSDTLGAALRAASDRDDVKAVVLRVSSPGGSYVASDAIRREVLRVSEQGTPVVASMGSVAASGGYYIAMPADRIVAGPGTLTGSIGVLAGKQVIGAALARIGVNRQSVSTAAFAEMFSSQRGFTDEEWRRLEEWLDRIYLDFTAKAAADRGMERDALHQVAKGRVWTGADALEHRLVDQLGGLDEAVDVACGLAGLRRRETEVRPLPRPNVLDRVRPPESSDHPVAGTALMPGLSSLMAALGLPPDGVLTVPTLWRFR